MTDSCRSHRSRKVVDYSSFGQEDGSDDDFDVQTPPLKKSKIDKKSNAKSTQPQITKPKKEKKSNQKNEEHPKKRDRVSLEKLEEQSFERELQKVLEISKQESQEDVKDVAVVHIQEHHQLKDVENIPPAVAPQSLPVHHPKLNQSCVTTQEAGIEVLEEDVREGTRPSRKASASRKSLAVGHPNEDDSDDDFNIGDVDNGSDVDFSDDGDESDYEVPKPKKMTKETKKRTVINDTKEKCGSKKSKPTSGKVSKHTKVTPSSDKKPISKVPAASVPVASVPTQRAATPSTTKTIGRGFIPPATSGVSRYARTPKEIIRKPVLTSPGGENPLGGIKLISPNQPRRLGLSRFARVKSLHTNIQMPT